MPSSRKPFDQIAAELGLPADASQALVAAITEQVRAQLQAEHEAVLARREAEVAAQVTAAVTADLKAKHLQEMLAVYEELRLHRRRMFGASSEITAEQGRLFDEAELAYAEQPDAPETVELPTDSAACKDTQAPKARGKRQPLSRDLPRVTIVHELPESERLCPCGTPMMEI